MSYCISLLYCLHSLVSTLVLTLSTIFEYLGTRENNFNDPNPITGKKGSPPEKTLLRESQTLLN